MLAVGWTCEIRVCVRVMRHGRLCTIKWADRLAILTFDACHVQTRLATDSPIGCIVRSNNHCPFWLSLRVGVDTDSVSQNSLPLAGDRTSVSHIATGRMVGTRTGTMARDVAGRRTRSAAADLSCARCGPGRLGGSGGSGRQGAPAWDCGGGQALAFTTQIYADTSGPAWLDADLADPTEMYDRLVIAMPRGHQAGRLETIWIHIQWTSRVSAVDRV
jgi:hypothetical protein